MPRWAAASEVQEGGPVATSHAKAAILFARRRLLKHCGELNRVAALVNPLSEPPGGPNRDYARTIRADWTAAPRALESLHDAEVDLERAKFWGRVSRALEEEPSLLTLTSGRSSSLTR